MPQDIDNMTGDYEDVEDDKDKLYFAYSASLRIFGDIGDIDAISKKLGVEPGYVHKKGEPQSKRNLMPWEFDMWNYKSPVPEDDH